jgi:hypothetical protein
MQERYHDYVLRKLREERMSDYDTKTYNWKDIEKAANQFVAMMLTDMWKPDYVVGVIPDGLVLATLISEKIDAELYTVYKSESNCWLAEDAFGVVTDVDTYKSRWDHLQRKKILVLNGTDDRDFFEWLVSDWQSACFPKEDYAWNAVWNNNVRFGAIGKNVKNNSTSVTYLYDTNEYVNHAFPWSA